MAQADLDAILKEFLDFGTVKSDINEISNNVKLISSKIVEIEKQLNYLAEQMLEQNDKADSVAQYVTEQIETFSEQIKDKSEINSIKTEQPSTEQAQQKQTNEKMPVLLSNATGRYREILSLLINEGFFSYSKLADRLSISQSRVRAYIADLKRYYSVPITSIKDNEGVKVGISPEFVDRILGVR
ncbi:MAG: HTH domain-containing protein [Candidatus Aenigmarchaeota archaeon]|nr:HTH domain-containing protein [Candidatus Aenigmarchaeota archaeon]